MIDSIVLSDVACFNVEQSLNTLRAVNFVFGSNGSGKTTISRLIADETIYPTCSIAWRHGQTLETMVYNTDFVERNFHQADALRGIFTLGENNQQILHKIEEQKEEQNAHLATLNALKRTLDGADGIGGKKKELEDLEVAFKGTCWLQKQKHDGIFKGAFEGLRNSADNFKQRVLREAETNTADTLPLEDLTAKAKLIFESTPTVEASLALLDYSSIDSCEVHPILAKKVIGKDDADISAMILKLGNSDWVKRGRVYYDVNDSFCPFCQQQTTEDFEKSLNEYFDEGFEKDSKTILDLVSSYSLEVEKQLKAVDQLIQEASSFLAIDNLKAKRELLASRFGLNSKSLASKQDEPSRTIALEASATLLSEIDAIIKTANEKVMQHNNTARNLGKERTALISRIWKYIVETELKRDILEFNAKKDGLTKAIDNIQRQIGDKQKAIATNKSTIERLEEQTTSSLPTVDAINHLLFSFGFQSFTLVAVDKASYKVLRPDQSDAKPTLSEGEKNFVMFLYFYHLLRGSMKESGMTTNRVVVFDDPISSLDSDIVFVASSLIKRLIEDVDSQRGHIKQVFVLTHNIYFHREVTYHAKMSRDNALHYETFWIIQKSGMQSRLIYHPKNPIKTSYELLWAEVKEHTGVSASLPNTLRRILENYFTILGDIDRDKICSHFESEDLALCRSLFSWVNSGSHFAFDDLYVDTGASNEKFLEVFRQVFIKSGHIAHYSMMMGDQVDGTIGSRTTRAGITSDRTISEVASGGVIEGA